MPRALITGITGQDGLYLGELLAAKGYEVFGVVRGQSNPKIALVEKIIPTVQLVEGDLTDLPSLISALEEAQPHEVYNLGAISFVGLSWKQAELTGEITGMGVLRMLEAIRIHTQGDMAKVRFYQASSSEMFGKVRETPQREATPFHPRSPYGVAKTFGHYMTVNYRESYGAFACSGILFNHESIPSWTPIMIRVDGYLDIIPIGDLVNVDALRPGSRITHPGGDGLEVWDGNQFVRAHARTAYWYDGDSIVAHGRGGVIQTTPDHVAFRADGTEQVSEALVAGDDLLLAQQPAASYQTTLTADEAWLLGVIAGDGYVNPTGSVCVTGSDESVLARAAACWQRIAAGTVRKDDVGSPSGFGKKSTPRIYLHGNTAYGRLLREELYCRDKSKRVPTRILNASSELQREFLDGYNQADGLKRGNGIDPFKSFRTTSPTLACGLVWLARTALGRRVTVFRQPGALGGGDSYLINLNSGLTPGRKGAHLRKPLEEIRKVERRRYTGFMCDLETETERFAAGVGLVVTHNSPRRGHEFVTRKVTRAVARIALGLQDTVSLGNLEARRDWGFAGDYVDAMWRMLQQPEPDDYVVATGRTHSIRELLDVAFARAGIDDWAGRVEQDPRYFRPAEVDLLIGDASKAEEKLGWRPTVSFRELIEMMVDADLETERPGS